jgi:hypothetical protein
MTAFSAVACGSCSRARAIAQRRPGAAGRGDPGAGGGERAGAWLRGGRGQPVPWRAGAGAALTGLERQPAYAALARENAARNGMALDVVEGDLAAPPPALRRTFDHVIANPPYFGPGSGTPARDPGREAARARKRRLPSGSTPPPGAWPPAAG